jgi:hypothetical protein
VPKGVVFATKPRQAVELLQEADEAGVPFGWVAGDGGYGQYREVRDWATTRSRRYVLAVPSSQPLERVHGIGGQAEVKRVDDLLARAHRWERRSCGHGTKGGQVLRLGAVRSHPARRAPRGRARPHPADPPVRVRPGRGGVLPGPRPADSARRLRQPNWLQVAWYGSSGA